VGTTYSWSAPTLLGSGGITGGVSGANQPSVSGTLFDTTDNPQTAIYTVTPYGPTGCKGNNFTVTVTVNPSPRVSFSPGPQTICSGDATALVTLSSFTTGASLPWNSTQPTGITGVTTSGTGSIPVQTLVNSTTQPITITYLATPATTGPLACPGVPIPYTIVVNPTPVVSNILIDKCTDSTFSVTPSPTLTGNLIPTGTIYSWGAPVVTGGLTGGVSGNGISINGVLYNPTNATQTAVYTVTPTSGATGSCAGNTFTVTVNVNPKPTIANDSLTICSDSSFIYVGSQTVLGNIIPANTTYSWGLPTVSAAGSVSGILSSSTAVSNVSATLINNTDVVQYVIYTITPYGAPNNCPGNPFTLKVFVNPKPTISGIQHTICSDSSFSIVPSTLVSSNIIPSGTTYSWSLPT
jgi:hypothetical protein